MQAKGGEGAAANQPVFIRGEHARTEIPFLRRVILLSSSRSYCWSTIFLPKNRSFSLIMLWRRSIQANAKECETESGTRGSILPPL
jgi:hypothetical protein